MRPLSTSAGTHPQFVKKPTPSSTALEDDHDKPLSLRMTQGVECGTKADVVGYLMSLVWFEVGLPGGMSVTVGNGGVVSNSSREVGEYSWEMKCIEDVGMEMAFSHSGSEMAGIGRDAVMSMARDLRDRDMSVTTVGMSVSTGVDVLGSDVESDVVEVVLSVDGVGEILRTGVKASMDTAGDSRVWWWVTPGEVRWAWDTLVSTGHAGEVTASAEVHLFDGTATHEVFSGVDMSVVSDVNDVVWGRRSFEDVTDVAIEEVIGGALYVGLTYFGMSEDGFEYAGLEVLEGAPSEELLSDILGRLSIRLIGTIRSVFADV